MHKIWGIRVEDDVEVAGLDVSEHGMWGYPEFYIPVPGGYGTSDSGHGAPHTGTPVGTAVTAMVAHGAPAAFQQE
jgi:Amt family ammonium transporter